MNAVDLHNTLQWVQAVAVPLPFLAMGCLDPHATDSVPGHEGLLRITSMRAALHPLHLLQLLAFAVSQSPEATAAFSQDRAPLRMGRDGSFAAGIARTAVDSHALDTAAEMVESARAHPFDLSRSSVMPLLGAVAASRLASSLLDLHFSPTCDRDAALDDMLLSVYLAGCRRLGLRCLFEPSDLEAGGDFDRVLRHIQELRSLREEPPAAAAASGCPCAAAVSSPHPTGALRSAAHGRCVQLHQAMAPCCSEAGCSAGSRVASASAAPRTLVCTACRWANPSACCHRSLTPPLSYKDHMALFTGRMHPLDASPQSIQRLWAHLLVFEPHSVVPPAGGGDDNLLWQQRLAAAERAFAADPGVEQQVVLLHSVHTSELALPAVRRKLVRALVSAGLPPPLRGYLWCSAAGVLQRESGHVVESPVADWEARMASLGAADDPLAGHETVEEPAARHASAATDTLCYYDALCLANAPALVAHGQLPAHLLALAQDATASAGPAPDAAAAPCTPVASPSAGVVSSPPASAAAAIVWRGRTIAPAPRSTVVQVNKDLPRTMPHLNPIEASRLARTGAAAGSSSPVAAGGVDVAYVFRAAAQGVGSAAAAAPHASSAGDATHGHGCAGLHSFSVAAEPSRGTHVSEGALRRLLLAFSSHSPVLDFVQGLPFVAAHCLRWMGEREAFAFYTALLHRIVQPDYFLSQTPGILRDHRVLEECLVADPHLHRLTEHLHKLGGGGPLGSVMGLLQSVTLQWFICLFTVPFTAAFTDRVWDALLFLGDEVLFRTALVLLRMATPRLLACRELHEAMDVLKRCHALCYYPAMHQAVFDVWHWPAPSLHSLLWGLPHPHHHDTPREPSSSAAAAAAASHAPERLGDSTSGRRSRYGGSTRQPRPSFLRSPAGAGAGSASAAMQLLNPWQHGPQRADGGAAAVPRLSRIGPPPAAIAVLSPLVPIASPLPALLHALTGQQLAGVLSPADKDAALTAALQVLAAAAAAGARGGGAAVPTPAPTAPGYGSLPNAASPLAALAEAAASPWRTDEREVPRARHPRVPQALKLMAASLVTQPALGCMWLGMAAEELPAAVQAPPPLYAGQGITLDTFAEFHAGRALPYRLKPPKTSMLPIGLLRNAAPEAPEGGAAPQTDDRAAQQRVPGAADDPRFVHVVAVLSRLHQYACANRLGRGSTARSPGSSDEPLRSASHESISDAAVQRFSLCGGTTHGAAGALAPAAAFPATASPAAPHSSATEVRLGGVPVLLPGAEGTGAGAGHQLWGLLLDTPPARLRSLLRRERNTATRAFLASRREFFCQAARSSRVAQPAAACFMQGTASAEDAAEEAAAAVVADENAAAAAAITASAAVEPAVSPAGEGATAAAAAAELADDDACSSAAIASACSSPRASEQMGSPTAGTCTAPALSLEAGDALAALDGHLSSADGAVQHLQSPLGEPSPASPEPLTSRRLGIGPTAAMPLASRLESGLAFAEASQAADATLPRRALEADALEPGSDGDGSEADAAEEDDDGAVGVAAAADAPPDAAAAGEAPVPKHTSVVLLRAAEADASPAPLRAPGFLLAQWYGQWRPGGHTQDRQAASHAPFLRREAHFGARPAALWATAAAPAEGAAAGAGLLSPPRLHAGRAHEEASGELLSPSSAGSVSRATALLLSRLRAVAPKRFQGTRSQRSSSAAAAAPVLPGSPASSGAASPDALPTVALLLPSSPGATHLDADVHQSSLLRSPGAAGGADAAGSAAPTTAAAAASSAAPRGSDTGGHAVRASFWAAPVGAHGAGHGVLAFESPLADAGHAVAAAGHAVGEDAGGTGARAPLAGAFLGHATRRMCAPSSADADAVEAADEEGQPDFMSFPDLGGLPPELLGVTVTPLYFRFC